MVWTRHLTSTPVWSLALLSKYCKPRAAAISDPALGLTTRRSPRSAWYDCLFIAEGARSTVSNLTRKIQIILLTNYLGRQEDARDVCWVWFPQLFHPFFCRRQCIFPEGYQTQRLWWKEYQIKSGPLNFPLFSHPLTLFLPIKRSFSQMTTLPCAVKYSKHKRRPRPSPSDVVGINLKNALIQILKDE